MSFWRPVDSRVFGDEKVRRLSAPIPNARDLWIWILIRPNHELPGLQGGGVMTLAEELGWPLEGTGEVFREVIEEGLAKHDAESRVIFLPRALPRRVLDGPRPQSPNVVRGWRKPFDQIPDSPLKGEWLQSLHDATEALGKPFAKAFRETFGGAFAQASRITQGQGQGQGEGREEEHEAEVAPATPAEAAAPDAPQNSPRASALQMQKAEQLARLLTACHSRRNPEAPTSEEIIAACAGQILRVIGHQGLSPSKIETAILYSQQSAFWSKRVTSGQSLVRYLLKAIDGDGKLLCQAIEWRAKQADREQRQRACRADGRELARPFSEGSLRGRDLGIQGLKEKIYRDSDQVQ